MTHLRKMMLEELERRNYSGTTKECYIRAVEEFASYFDTTLGLRGMNLARIHLVWDDSPLDFLPQGHPQPHIATTNAIHC